MLEQDLGFGDFVTIAEIEPYRAPVASIAIVEVSGTKGLLIEGRYSNKPEDKSLFEDLGLIAAEAGAATKLYEFRDDNSSGGKAAKYVLLALGSVEAIAARWTKEEHYGFYLLKLLTPQETVASTAKTNGVRIGRRKPELKPTNTPFLKVVVNG